MKRVRGADCNVVEAPRGKSTLKQASHLLNLFFVSLTLIPSENVAPVFLSARLFAAHWLIFTVLFCHWLTFLWCCWNKINRPQLSVCPPFFLQLCQSRATLERERVMSFMGGVCEAEMSGRISSAPPTCGTDVLGQSKLDVYPSQHENMKTGCSKWPRPHLPRPIITPSLMIFKCVYISHLRVSIGVRTDGEIGPRLFEFRRFQFHRCENHSSSARKC